MKRTSFRLLVVSLVMAAASTAWAFEDGLVERQQRQYMERLREQLDRPPDQLEDRLGVDWGGWLNFSLNMFEDATDEGRVLRRSDMYLWGRAVVDKSHEFYARMRLSFMDWNTGDSPDHKDDDWEGPKLDRLFWRYDHREAVRKRDGLGIPWTVGAKVGRQYVEWGTGLALSMPMDAVQIWGEYNDLELTWLFGHPIESWDSFDRSPGVSDSTKRDFYGLQFVYKGIPNHEPFAYYLWQQDHTDEDPEISGQEYDYDSEYLGFGSRGRLCIPNLYYQTEFVFERGRSYGVGMTTNPDHIHAFAFDTQVNYVIESKHQPILTFEYLFASGDDDRTSPTDTANGNLAGTSDHGYNGFGFRNTGMAFAPPLSNLQMIRLGGNFRPLPEHPCFRDMTLGADAYYFLKHENKGGGPEARASNTDANLGQEIDIYMNWRVRSDILWTVRYGAFFPGDAFTGTRSSRNFFFTGVSFSF